MPVNSMGQVTGNKNSLEISGLQYVLQKYQNLAGTCNNIAYPSATLGPYS